MKNIREKAMEILAQKKNEIQRNDEPYEKVIHELQVHQIELELQNEELLEVQQKLEKSKKHYYSLFHKSPVGYLVLSQKGEILEANDKAVQLLSNETTTIKNRYLVDFLTDVSRNIFLMRFKAFFNDPEGKTIELQIENKERKLFVDIRAEKMEFLDKIDNENLFVSVNDVTQRKIDQEKIDHLNLVLNSIRKIDRLVSFEKDISKLASEAVKILSSIRGYKNVWIGLFDENNKTLKEFFSHEQNDTIQTIKNLLEQKKHTHCIKKALDTDGVVEGFFHEKECISCPICEKKMLYCSYTARLQYDSEIYGLISVGLEYGFHRSEDEKIVFNDMVNDISFAIHSRKEEDKVYELYNNLKKEKDLINNIVNTTPSGITFVNRDGNIIFANKWARKILNLAAGDKNYAYNDSRFQITDLDGNDFPEDHLPFNLIKKTKKPVYNLKHSIHWESGKKIDLSISSSPIFSENNELDGIISVFDDITKQVENEKERLQLEKSLNRSQKLETIGTLAGGIAHDFNNILTPILGYSEIIMSQKLDIHTIKDDIMEIHKAALRARDIVAQILSFSRNDEQKRTPVKTCYILKETLKLLRPSLPTTIEIRMDIEENCKMIMADSSKIHQVIMNLCTNAYHAMEKDGGLLIITQKQITIQKQQGADYLDLIPGEYIQISVKDTGVGIESENIEKIFEPFFTTKPVDRGTGLGLSVVHGIVKSHGGVIEVNSQPGIGTEFILYFPVISADDTTKDVLDKEFSKGTERILIVDDNISVARLAEKLLKFLGYKIVVKHSSTAALEWIVNNPGELDLLLTDFTMPGITGLDLAHKVHEEIPDLPIIMMSGYGTKITRDQQKKAGILKILTKPILIQELSHEIREIFDEYK